MVEWVATGEGVRAVGNGAEVVIGTTGWQPDGTACALPARVDTAVSGSAAGLWLPTATASLAGRELVPPAELPEDEHLLRFDNGVETLVRFSGPVTIDREEGGMAVQFRERSGVTLGFRAERECPPEMTVPPTPDGLAMALSEFASALRTTDPRRSHPAFRDHPPLVKFGDEDIPHAICGATPDTGVEFLIPRCLEHLFVAAPLSYYLGARVRLCEGPPRLRAPAVDFEVRLPRLPNFQEAVADLLRRVVFLDCLLRDMDGLSPEGNAGEALPDSEVIDPSVSDLPSDERLATYAAVPAGDLEPHLPEWHLSASVAPRVEHTRALPYLLDRLCLVYLPEATDLAAGELLKRTLDDFYRGEVATVEMLAPERGVGRVHGWLADGTPVDAFKATASAHEHRLAGREPGDVLDVAVVLNDPEMEDERAVADIYRERAAELPVDVKVHESLGRRDLAGVFEQPYDFVHYVGHCEVEGLRCQDGYLATDDLERVRARTFFLNACGSYHQGLGLVERGAVAGGVTLASVLNDPAVTVGTTFARLLVHGFGIERALRLARRRVIMGKDYAVVGDGTFAPAPRYGDPAVASVARQDGTFRVTYEVLSSQSAGRCYRDPFRKGRRLYGTESGATLDREELTAFLEDHSLPVVFDGDLQWAGELADRLREG